MVDIYHKDHERALLVLDASDVPKEDKKAIRSYVMQRMATGMKKVRAYKVILVLRRISLMLGKPFGKATKEDIIELVNKFNNGRTPDKITKAGKKKEGHEWSDHTKSDFKIVLKSFFKWYKGNDEAYPPVVSWLKNLHVKGKRLDPNSLINEDEIKRLIAAATHPRDRALISILAESGVRLGELLTLKISQIQYDQYGAILFVEGKTGQRRIRLLASTPYLSEWLNIHPLKDEIGAPVWLKIGTYGSQKTAMSESAVRLILRNAARIAKVKKRINPHSFRHARATFMASRLTDAQLKEQFGWTQGSDMAATYIHMSGRDTDGAILGIYGIKTKEEEKQSKLSPQKCERCNFMNGAATKYCSNCGAPIDAEERMKFYNTDKTYRDLIEYEVKRQLGQKSAATDVKRRK